MLYYVFGTLLSVIIAIIIKKGYGFEKRKTLKMFIAILPLTLISAFRYDVGWDYVGIYAKGYYLVGQYGLDWFTEEGFRFLIKILYSITDNYIILIVIMSVLTAIFFSKCYSVYGNENKCYIYIILYVLTRYYFCSLNIIRQALAMLIILYALHYLVEKKYFKYIIFVLLATSFHRLSIIYLILGFILQRNLKKKKDLLLAAICVPLLLVSVYMFLSESKYMNYFDSMFGNDSTLIYSELLICISILIPSVLNYKKIKEQNKMFVIFLNMELIVLILCLASFALPTADRIIWYISMQNIFLIPMILESFSKKENKVVFGIIIYASLSLVFFNQTILEDSYAILPYNNIFNSDTTFKW